MMKRLRERSADRISKLPDDVIERILVLLPLGDAARTSVLSTKWKHHWRKIPKLVFDKEFGRSLVRDGTVLNSMDALNNRLILIIYKTLLLHDGPVTTFKLSFLGLMPSGEIDQFILYLSGRGIQEFTLCAPRSDYRFDVLLSSLYSAPDLRYLKLKFCTLTKPPSWFLGHNKLTYLELKGVVLPDNFFESFVPGCPLLEALRVTHCDGPDKLEIVAPVLKAFYCQDVVQTLSFKCTPLLSLLLLDVSELKTNILALLASLPAIEEFTVNFENLFNIGESNHVTSSFQTIKRLCVDDVFLNSIENARRLVSLIMCLPNLQRLTIQLETYGQNYQDEDAIDIPSILETAENCHGSDCFQQLREFTIEGILGTNLELEFVRFALATGPVLRTVCILPSHRLCSKRERKFMKQVMQLKRVSKEAEVKYGWDDDDDDE
ncbi:F-box/FBD/LRR-repeat protein At1g13570 [Linum grandiflorum]